MFPGFAATEVLYGENGAIVGVATGNMGVDRNHSPKPTFEPGYELTAKYTLFAEGCRGHLGKQLIERFHLSDEQSPQHYAIGLKELWEIPKENHELGKVVHTLGWPLGLISGTTGGGFLYHVDNNQVSLGLIVDLAYSNPHLSPFDEFQRWKTHPLIKTYLIGGRRISYGARAIVKGGLNSLPEVSMPGGLLIGDDAGFLNPLKVKGSHSAMKSGMLAAEAVFDSVKKGNSHETLNYSKYFEDSWLFEELYESRNSGPAWHKFGMLFGSAWLWAEQVLFRGQNKINLWDDIPDHETLNQPHSRNALTTLVRTVSTRSTSSQAYFCPIQTMKKINPAICY